MATLTSTKIKNTYDALLKASDNDAIGSSAKQITDGLGNGTPLYISTTQIGIGVTPEATYDLHVYSNAKVGGNLTVTGDLTVEGTVTTVSSETLTVTDPLIELAKDNTSTDALDIGFYGKYAPSGTTLYAGLFRDTGDSKFKLFRNLEEQPTTTVNTGGTGYTVATLVADVEGTLTGIIASSTTATTQSANDNSTKVATTAYVDTSAGNYLPLAGGTMSGSIAMGGNNISGGGTATFTSFVGDLTGNADTATALETARTIQVSGDVAGSASFDGTADINISTTIQPNSVALGTDTTGNYVATIEGTANEITVSGSGSESAAVTISLPSSISVDVTGDLTGDVYNADGSIILNTGDNSIDAVLSNGVRATTQSQGDNSTKLATTAYVDSAIGGQDTLSEVLANGNTTGGTDIAVSSGDDITFVDDSKAIFGTDGDLEIYHYSITDIAQITINGELDIRANTLQLKNYSGETYFRGASNGAVRLYYDGVEKFITTSTGISVTGGASFTDNIDINGNNKHIRWVDTYGNWLIEVGDGANNFKIHSQSLAADYLTLEGGGQLNLGEYGSGSFTGTATYRLAVDSSGDVIEIPIGDGAVDGSGTANYVAKWSDTDTITNSVIYDDGTNVGIGTPPSAKLDVNGDVYIRGGGYLYVDTLAGYSSGVITLNSNTNFIVPSGNVGIGTTSPASPLQVVATGIGAEGTIGIQGANAHVGFKNSSGTFRSWVGHFNAATHGSDADLNLKTGYGTTGNIRFSADGDTTAAQMFLQGSSGNVGIGTTSPDSKLHVDSGVSSTSDWGNLGIISDFPINNTGRIYTSYLLQDSESIKGAGIGLAYDGTGYKMHFGTASTTSSGLSTQMTIDRLGNLGIGTDSPAEKLDVNGSINLRGGQIYAAADGSNTFFANAVQHIFRAGSSGSYAERMRIDSSGNVGIGVSSLQSWARLQVAGTAGAQTGANQALYVTAPSTTAGEGVGIRLSAASGSKEAVGIIGMVNNASGNSGSMTFHTYNGGADIPERMRIDSGGILKFTNVAQTRKIQLWGTQDNDYEFYGFGVEGSTLVYSTYTTGDDHVFFAGTSSTTRNELMRIGGDGNVGIGTTSIDASSPKLEVSGSIMSTSSSLTAAPTTASVVMDYHSSDNTGRIMAGSGGSWNKNLSLVPYGGSVGIGETNPASKLEVYGNVQSDTISIANSAAYIRGADVGIAIGQSASSPYGTWIQSLRNTDGVTFPMSLNPNGGNVGISTTSPTNGKLEVQQTATTAALWVQTGGTTDSYTIADFRTGTNASALAIKGNGNVEIGTGRVDIGTRSYVGSATSTTRLYLEGNTNGHNLGQFQMADLSGGFMFYLSGSSPTSRQSHQFYNNRIDSSPTLVGSIQINSSSTAFNTSSDYRLKENVVEMTGALDRVGQLKPSRFNFIGHEEIVDGFLAHEVSDIVPEAITGTKDEVDEEGNPVYQGIDQSKLVPLLVGAIKELKAEIETLKAQINN